MGNSRSLFSTAQNKPQFDFSAFETNYRPAAAEDAWQRTVAFFKQNLKAA